MNKMQRCVLLNYVTHS